MKNDPEFIITRKSETAPDGESFFNGQIELVQDTDGESNPIAQTSFFLSEAHRFSTFDGAAAWAALMDPFNDTFRVSMLVPGAEPRAIPVAVMPAGWCLDAAGQSDA